MTADERYLFLIRNIRRRINDTASQDPSGEILQPVFTNEDLKDEIDLAIPYIDQTLDILSLRTFHNELVVLRVWCMVCKMLAFDSAKFFSFTQTNQTINKGERTQHYMSVAGNLERLFDDAVKRQIDGYIITSDLKILNRDGKIENTAIADTPPKSTILRSFVSTYGATNYKDGDYRLEWERSMAWDFCEYRCFIGDSPKVDRYTGRVLFSIVNSEITNLILNFSTYEKGKPYYLVMYVLDNREQYSVPSDPLLIEFPTGSV